MISIKAPGGYEKLEYTALPECGFTEGANMKMEAIGPEQCVTIETYACGINYADICIRWGLYKSAKEYVGYPITPGFEFSGTIVGVGSDVNDFKVGDKVAGLSLFGAYSTRIRVPANQVRKIPEGIGMSVAASFLCVGCTAWYAIYELCRLRHGDWILVHSAAGGVGSMLVQMGKKIGCKVIGVVGSSHKVEFAKQLGCDGVIDKSTQDLWSTAKDCALGGYKAIFDANGVATLRESYNHLKPGGRLVSYGSHTLLPKSSEATTGYIGMMEWLKIGWNYKSSPTFNPMEMMSENKSVMAFNLSFMFGEKELTAQCLSDLFTWMEDGSLLVPSVTEFHIKNAGEAHRALESGSTVGKLVLLTQDDVCDETSSVEEACDAVEGEGTELMKMNKPQSC